MDPGGSWSSWPAGSGELLSRQRREGEALDELVTHRVAFGNTPTMSDMPAATLYHRWLGWHALELRRAGTVLALGLLVTLALMFFVTLGLALVGGWDAAASAFLLTIWPIIGRADSSRAERLATREDPTRVSATALLTAGSVASLLGVGFALRLGGRQSGAPQVLLCYQVSDTARRHPRLRRTA